MTPIEALRAIRKEVQLELRGLVAKTLFDLADEAISTYENTHPAEGGEGRVVGYYVSTRNECDEEMGYLYLSSTEAQRHADEPSSYHWTVEPVYTAPPPQPVAPEACGYCGRNPREPTHDLNCPVAPERGEAKAVAPVNPQQLAAWLTAGFGHCGVDTCAAEVLNVVEATLPPLYATPQPPPAPICGRCGKPRSELCGDDFIPATTPAPRFRDPTIEDAVRMLDAQNHFNGSSVKRTLAALNAIGAKVGEKT